MARVTRGRGRRAFSIRVLDAEVKVRQLQGGEGRQHPLGILEAAGLQVEASQAAGLQLGHAGAQLRIFFPDTQNSC